MTPQERTEFIEDIASALCNRSTDTTLTDDEQRWVRLAIQREAQSIQLRKAIIEKTLGGLVWSAIIGLGYMVLGWATQHGFKP